MGDIQIHGQALSNSEKLQLKIANIDYEIKKRLAFRYYFDPYSPTFMNALGSLTRAGYSYNYARSYGSKVFFMARFVNSPFIDRFIDALYTDRFTAALFGLGKTKESK